MVVNQVSGLLQPCQRDNSYHNKIEIL